MANSRKIRLDQLGDRYYVGLKGQPQAQATYTPFFLNTDDLGIIKSPRSVVTSLGYPESVIDSLLQVGFIGEADFQENQYYYFRDWDQSFQYFQLSALANTAMLVNLFISANGQVVFKDHADNANHDFVKHHKLLIERIYKKSADFNALAVWATDNSQLISQPMQARLRLIYQASVDKKAASQHLN
ncbi:hypothetical protein [Oenococcus kitaharae]|uniref:Uncharacterized protein n=1 Tax=Oenococcus kitaharae DSM 17330 TaxID=1045004 RepID=G9WFC7_9LACO|nr:hypothetical protein [Oenococcus kitaharae]EHN59084.1 hypothetical protein OKIT_0981 [Oenococcus kitaharae DSM 17330]OEY82535.1 hypothetical protein NT95_06190 [Oenococcus kitaharae]OEY84149.1 hypothetical protein NV75_04620 [Oenococcus kitaharae]OEY84645.1 hypothetical protein NT96_05235 [Oenococcus kitaharae]